jgi:16S rRNA (adenine1518-N6/adenine1519-N6)-dimethyltransferase
MTRKEIIHFLNDNTLSPNKRLGQNFLCDATVTARIISAAEIISDDSVLEIGPGLGELTTALLDTGCTLTSVEIDSGLFRYLVERLNGHSELSLVHADFLKTEKLGSFNKIAANLPYYCASEILFKCAEEYSPDLMCVMLQKEMAERIVSKPGTESYGAMTVMLAAKYTSAIAFDASPASFYPSPDVTSSILVMRRSQTIALTSNEFVIFALLVKSAFWGRRKTLVKSCSSSPHHKFERAILLDALSSLGLNDAIRGEALSVDQFAAIARIICKAKDVL